MKITLPLLLTCAVWMFAATALLADPVPAQDPVLAALYEGHKVRAEIREAPSGKVMVLLDGQPRPLYWADLADPSEDYKRAGLNTVFFECYYPGKAVPLDEVVKGWDQSLLAIKKQGLYVIVHIHNSIHESAGKVPFAFDPQWRDFVQTIVRRYRPMTNLIGWNLSDEPADHLTYPDGAFRESLRGSYTAIEALNKAWGSSYREFSDIRLEYLRDGHGRPEDSMVTPAFPFGIGPKAFDSARFKVDRMAWAHAQFANAVGEADPDTPLWSGAQNIGWALTQVPPGWGVFHDFYPGHSGNDMDTHHIWAMDIGRGPNMRPAMQMLLPEHFDNPKWLLDARVLRGWMVESAIHGAAGITFWPWSFLGKDNLPGARSSSTERIAMCHDTISTLESSGIFEMLPCNTVAIIYQPYAEGWGAFSQVYGLLRYPSEEPHILFQQLKFGTRYGQVDYLTRLDLPGLDLDRYGVVIAQFTPDLSAGDLKHLTGYVENGGVLFADIGFDCIRAGKTLTSMTPEAMRLFGIKTVTESKAGAGRFVATGRYSDLLGNLNKDTDSTDDISQYLLDVEPSTAAAAMQGPGGQGIYVNRVGKGYAIFCSGQAWSRWSVSDRLFRRIHNALFSRRAGIEWIDDKAPDADTGEPNFSRGYEIARFTTGYAIQNRTDAAVTAKVRVESRLATHQLKPRSVLLVNKGKEYDLGTGIWKVELGPR